MLNSTANFPEEVMETFESIAEFEGNNFGEIVEISGLSKGQDFVGADLRYVDFSNTDLRGYNFKGADLSGSHGIHIRFDETTNLEGAAVVGSCFALEQEKRLFFAANEDQKKIFDKLVNDYWANGSIWIGDNLKPSSSNYETASKIAKYLYKEVRDQSYKNQILYGLKNTFKERQEYLDFLLGQISSPYTSIRSIRGILDILGRVFSNNATAKNILFNYLNHEDPKIREVCIPAVMTGNIFKQNSSRIIESMRQEELHSLRKLYTKCFSSMLSIEQQSLLYSAYERTFLDYKQDIDEKAFRSIIQNAIYAKKLSSKINLTRSTRSQVIDDPAFIITVTDKEVTSAKYHYDTILKEICSQGLPLNQTYSLSSI